MVSKKKAPIIEPGGGVTEQPPIGDQPQPSTPPEGATDSEGGEPDRSTLPETAPDATLLDGPTAEQRGAYQAYASEQIDQTGDLLSVVPDLLGDEPPAGPIMMDTELADANKEAAALQAAQDECIAEGVDVSTLLGRVEVERRARVALGMPEMAIDPNWRDKIDRTPGHGLSDEDRADLDGVITLQMFYGRTKVHVTVQDSSGLTSVPVGSPAHTLAWAMRAALPTMFQFSEHLLQSMAAGHVTQDTQQDIRQAPLQDRKSVV